MVDSLESAAPEPGLPAIELRDVWVSFGDVPVLEAIDLQVAHREFLGIIGPNGAGKTVLLKVLLGLVQPDRGTVRVLGRSARDARGAVGYVPQHSAFDRLFPVRVLDVVLMGHLGARPRVGSAVARERALEALDRVKLADLAGRQIGKLSGGQIQRTLIARALATETQVLLLDEPASNLDPRIAGEIYELLGHLAEDRAVILVDHDVGVMSRHVGSVACLNRRLHYHAGGEINAQMMQRTYGYPVDVLVHDHAHGERMLEPHPGQRKD